MVKMPGVSREQIERAKKTDLLTYLQRHEPDAIKKSGADEYALREHDSLKISNGLWHWFSRGIGGKSALDFLVYVRGMNFVEAVRLLSFDTPAPPRSPPPEAPSAAREEKPLPALPAKNTFGTKATSYLRDVRGIDPEILTQCLAQKKLYEGVYNGQTVCVFVGRDKDGIPRYAAVRGVDTGFKGEVKNSDKRYGFVVTSSLVPCHRLIVTESAIDAMSVASIVKRQAGRAYELYEYLSLGSTSPLAVLEYLKTHSDTQKVVLCLDNDEAGQIAREKIRELLTSDPDLRERALEVTDRIPAMKDWNEELLAIHGGDDRRVRGFVAER
jgi:5S rRNA maturation endonuclease (ribonuclease M5)